MRIIAILFFVVAMAFAQPHPANTLFRVAYCTSVYGVDYCNEANYLVRLAFVNPKQIDIVRTTYGERVLLTVTPRSKWMTDASTGDSYMKLRIGNETDWKLIAREKAYILVNENCSMIELWHGSRKTEHAAHGYIRVDEFDDVDALTDRCIAEMNTPKKKIKKKAYDSGLPIFGMLN